MSLTSSLANVGHAVAYYPKLSRFFGSVNSSIFFSQLYYWQSRASDERGVFKTAEEWTEETGLSYREQVTARKILVEKKFLSEIHKRLQHRVYYKLDLPAVDAAFDAWNGAQPPSDISEARELRKRSSGTTQNAVGWTTKAQPVNKEKITAETPEGIGFASFWSAYPKKVAKPAALKAWKAAKAKADELTSMLSDIAVRVPSDDWQKEGGKYVPNPATYLNQRRWEDGQAPAAEKVRFV